MKLPLKSTLAAFLTSVALLSQPAMAEDGPSRDQVLAIVNGVEITLGHVIMTRASLPQQYAQYPAEALFDGILQQLIQQTLLMQDHKGDLKRASELLIENERRTAIAGEVIEEVFNAPLDEADIQKAYDAAYVNEAGTPEFKAAHILVATEEEAADLAQQLKDGADFATLAKEHSTGPSGTNGGELGWFADGMMVEPFFNAVETLEPGQVSDPVKTQFGWHLILLQETRIKDAPTLEETRAELEQSLRQAGYEAYIERLERAADIEKADLSDIDPNIVNNLTLLED